MKTSESITEIATALSVAQSEMSGAKKSTVNPFFKSKFADFTSAVDAIKEPFANNNLSYVQDVFSEGDKDFVSTRILHKSGQWIEFGPQRVPVKDKENPQAVKSGITYMKRTQLMSACGLPEVDDDGNDAAKVTPINGKADVVTKMKALGVSESDIKKKYSVKDVKELNDMQLMELSNIGKNIKDGKVKLRMVFPLADDLA